MRIIESKYAGTCETCGKAVEVGQRIRYQKGVPVTHETCDPLTYEEQREALRQRAESRAERFGGYAASAEANSERAFKAVHEIADNIPLGQPILVGHHSERHARRDAQRIEDGMRKGIDEADRAAGWKGRAAHNEKLAEGDERHSLRFIDQRIADTDAELRDLDRRIAGTCYTDGSVVPASGDYLAMLEGHRAEAVEKRAYWAGLLEKRGGVAYSSDTIKVGDAVNGGGWGWCKVERVNRLSVTIRYHWTETYSTTQTVRYAAITKHRSKDAPQ